MSLQQINNEENAAPIRAKLNAWLAQILTNTTNITTNTSNISSLSSSLSSLTTTVDTKQDEDAISTVYNRVVKKTGAFSISLKNDFYYATNSENSQLQIPPDNTSDFPVGSMVYVSNIGTNPYIITPDLAVTMVYHNSTSSAIDPNKTAIIIKVDANTWLRFL